jgi:hypothetical protein
VPFTTRGQPSLSMPRENMTIAVLMSIAGQRGRLECVVECQQRTCGLSRQRRTARVANLLAPAKSPQLSIADIVQTKKPFRVKLNVRGLPSLRPTLSRAAGAVLAIPPCRQAAATLSRTLIPLKS